MSHVSCLMFLSLVQRIRHESQKARAFDRGFEHALVG